MNKVNKKEFVTIKSAL